MMNKRWGWFVVAVALAALAGSAMAQGLTFPTGQVVVIDASDSGTYWATDYNYTSAEMNVNGPFTLGQAIAYDLPGGEWVGMFLYELDMGYYTLAQYNLRTTIIPGPGLRKAEVVELLGDSLAGLNFAASSALAFSPSSSQVVVSSDQPSAQMYYINYESGQGEYREIPQLPAQAININLTDAEGWIGCFLYDTELGQWVNEAYYSTWGTLPPPEQEQF